MSFETKSPLMQSFLNQMAKQMYGRTVTEAHEQLICVDCGETPDFDGCTHLDKNEYWISGLCPSCFEKICIYEDD